MSFSLPGVEVFTTALTNVLYIPDIAINFFSVTAVIRKGN